MLGIGDRALGVPLGSRDPRRKGLSLVEVLIALTVLLMGLGGFLRILTASFRLGETSDQLVTAMEAARSIVEELHGEDFTQVFPTYNGATSDNPAGKTSPGDTFQVAGLLPAEADADDTVGEILFPTDPANPARLTELASSGFPGMPKDLNLDGDDKDANVTADFKLLPVVIRLRWQSSNGGEQAYEVRTILADAP
jgi:hypothetical protein